MKRYQLYIFNFDNTLFDTSQGLEICYQKALKEIGAEYQPEMLGEFIREPIRETFGRYGSDETEYKKFEKAFFEASDDVIRDNAVIFDDTYEVIRLLKNEGRNLSIVTGKSPDAVRDVLQKYKMSGFFEHVFGHGDYDNGLPDPEPLLLCIDNYPDVHKNDIAYIGDSRFDMEAARRAGIGSVFIDRDPAEVTENRSSGKCCLRIKTLYGLVAECRICITSVFTIQYDILEDVNLNNIMTELGKERRSEFRLVKTEKNYARIEVGENVLFNVFPHGIIVRSFVSDNVYPLDTENILEERDRVSKGLLNDADAIGDIVHRLDAIVRRQYPHLKKDRIVSRFSEDNNNAYNVTTYHMSSPLGGVFESHFGNEIMQLLTKKNQTLDDDLYAQLDKNRIPYNRINDAEMLAAVWDSRVFISEGGSGETFKEYLEFEAKAQNSWFLTSLMNEAVDNLTSSELDDYDLISETLDTMYTNATFRYVVSSSGRREQGEMMDVLYKANNLESIFNDFRNKADLLNQKIELSIRSSDARSSQMLNNILLALTIVSSVSAVFQILGYWSINPANYNFYSLLGSVIMILAVMGIYLITNRGSKRKKRVGNEP